MCLSKASIEGKTMPQLQVICCWPASIRPRAVPPSKPRADTAVAADVGGDAAEATLAASKEAGAVVKGGGCIRGTINDEGRGDEDVAGGLLPLLLLPLLLTIAPAMEMLSCVNDKRRASIFRGNGYIRVALTPPHPTERFQCVMASKWSRPFQLSSIL